MNPLPDRLNLDHLKKQAKDLIRLYRSRDPAAMVRFRNALPAVAGRNDEDISSAQLRLHDAQSCYCPRVWLHVLVRPQTLRGSAGGHAEGTRRAHPALGPAALFRRRQRHAQPRKPARCLADSGRRSRSDRRRSLARLRDRGRKRAAAGDAGRSGMGQPARRPLAVATAFRSRAFEPAARGGIPRAAASQRAMADRGMAPTSTSISTAAGRRDR